MTAMILPKLGNCKDYRQAEDALLAMGAREIGRGHFSRIYRIVTNIMPQGPTSMYDVLNMRFMPPTTTYRDMCGERVVRIIKVTKQRDKGALIVAKAAMACADVDPMAPVYYGITEFSDGCFMAEMEPLEKMHDMGHHCGLTGTEKGLPAYRQNHKPLPEAIRASPFLTLLNHYIGKGYVWDLHSDNVMMRGAQPVITDPMFLSADC